MATILLFNLENQQILADNPVEPGESTAYYESTLTTSNLGDYNFVLKAYERPSHEVLPIVDETYFPTSTLSVQSKLDNIAPSARYDAMNKAKVDIVFACYFVWWMHW